MSEYKYPYIPKQYYAAVMFACKMIRETENKNRSIRTAANYYGVDEDEVRKHVDRRAAAGAKGRKSTSKGRKYKWFVIGEFYGTDAGGENAHLSSIGVCKGLSAKTVVNRYSESDFIFDRRNDYGGAYAPYRLHKVLGEYENRTEAEEAVRTIKDGESE